MAAGHFADISLDNQSTKQQTQHFRGHNMQVITLHARYTNRPTVWTRIDSGQGKETDLLQPIQKEYAVQLLFSSYWKQLFPVVRRTERKAHLSVSSRIDVPMQGHRQGDPKICLHPLPLTKYQRHTHTDQPNKNVQHPLAFTCCFC